jgi:hypothetical protein
MSGYHSTDIEVYRFFDEKCVRVYVLALFNYTG